MRRNLGTSEFCREFGPVFDKVFAVPAKMSRDVLPFRSRDWQTVAVVAYHSLEPVDYCAVRVAATAGGDTEVVLTDAEAEPRHRYPVVFSWEEDLYKVYMQGPVGTDAALFGRCGNWGVYFVWDARIAYVSGRSAFMETFMKNADGLEGIRTRLRIMLEETRDPYELDEIRLALAPLGWTIEELLETRRS
jgi:hypothetical protein